MDRQAWSRPADRQEAYRRTGDRRAYNAARRRAACRRLILLARALARNGSLADVLRGTRASLPRGMIAGLAVLLGVHRSTVWRDVQRLGRWPYRLDYSGDTGMVVIRLPGLVEVTYDLAADGPGAGHRTPHQV